MSKLDYAVFFLLCLAYFACTVSSRPIHVVANDTLLLFWVRIVFICITHTTGSLPAHWWVPKLFPCCGLLRIMLQWMWECSSLSLQGAGCTPGWEIAGSNGSSVLNFFSNLCTIFCNAIPICISTGTDHVQESPLFHSHWHLLLIVLFFVFFGARGQTQGLSSNHWAKSFSPSRCLFDNTYPKRCEVPRSGFAFPW